MPHRSLLLATCSALAFVGCAHAQATPAPEVATARPTPAPVAQPAPAPAKPVDDGLADLEAMLRGDVLHFDYDAVSLMPESRHRLQNIAQILSQHPQLSVRIEGNCDERGTEDYNLQLGQARADAARKYLVDLGVESSHISTLSYGKDRPANPAHDADAWAENRRDDIRPANGL
jgi:peptidoglycan-associated lipoprotein